LIVRWHHEWWNGGGYPDAIESEQIPVAARILRVADTFSALTSARPFRPAMSLDNAKKYITEWAGIEFDPSAVKALLSIDLPEEISPQPTAPGSFEGGLSIL
jgi:HD-GYP domain-containing protein (c-di-GMP phosphodiesterase class II)